MGSGSSKKKKKQGVSPEDDRIAQLEARLEEERRLRQQAESAAPQDRALPAIKSGGGGGGGGGGRASMFDGYGKQGVFAKQVSQESTYSIRDADQEFDVLTTAMAKRWLAPSKLLELCDEDGSGEMDYDEYSRVLKELRLKVPEAVAMAVFKTLDADGSGTISGPELEAALADVIEEKIAAAAAKSMREKQAQGTPYDNPATLPKLKLVSLVAHNHMKPSMMAFVASHMWFFKHMRIITTGSTGKALEQKLGITVDTKVSSGPLGGDQEIGARISQGDVGIVFFFRDPLSAHPHDADIIALTRLCDVHDCAIATNPATANGIMNALLKTPVGTVLEVADDDDSMVSSGAKKGRRESSVVSAYKAEQSQVINNVSK